MKLVTARVSDRTFGGVVHDDLVFPLPGAQTVDGTPGRLIDHAGQRLLDLSNATEVVLDEADKMLDLGFLADIEKIFSKVPPVRHTQLFSATMPGPIVALARRFMTNPIHIRANDPDQGQQIDRIERVADHQPLRMLLHRHLHVRRQDA